MIDKTSCVLVSTFKGIAMHIKEIVLGVSFLMGACYSGFSGETGNNSATTGRLHLVFKESSPLSSLEEICGRTDFDHIDLKSMDEAEKNSLRYKLADESFLVYVPDTYKPNVPYGLFVWIGIESPEVPPAWLDVFRRHRLILISVCIKGTQRHASLIPMGLALDGIHNMKKLYKINEDRIYVSGFSGGGFTASLLVRGYPDVIRGGYFMLGYDDFYDGRKNENKLWEVGIEGKKWHGELEQIKKKIKLVILSGANDPFVTRGGDKAAYDGLLLDGFQRASFIEMPRVGHVMPDAKWFEKGIDALESKPKTPPETSPTKAPNPLATQEAQAKRILVSAQSLLEQPESVRSRSKDMAKKYLLRVLDEYPTTPAATKARKLLDGLGE